MKILLLDLETSPNTAYVWKIWLENIGINQLIESSEVMCWSAKWLGEDEIMFDSNYQSSTKKMLKGLHKLLDEADAVVTYNGNRFDIPVANKEFLLYGMAPPAPYKRIDLYQTVKRQFKFVSNKLTYVCAFLGIGKKIDTDFQLWIDCMNRDPKAWAEMEKYNRNDVTLLEGLYLYILPWIENHPNHGMYADGKLVCPNCGGDHIQKRGFSFAKALKYIRFQCQGCGRWFKSSKAVDVDKKPKFGKI